MSNAMLDISDLHLTLGFGIRRSEILHGVDLTVPRGATVGIVGESGSGKSTLAKAIVGIHRPDSGTMRFNGADITHAGSRVRKKLRRQIQLIPQDPYSSLSPRRTIAQTLSEAIDPARPRARRAGEQVAELLEMVGLDAGLAERYPQDFSGGQRQRIAIARAIAVQPQLVVADEVTSALDLSSQARILELLTDLKTRLDLTMVFISHNLAVVHSISDYVVVLYNGDVVEHGPAAEVFAHPRAAYTMALLDAVPGAPGFSLDAR